MPAAAVPPALLDEARRGFAARFGAAPTHAAYAPGRVELLGNHTDYNGGSVACAALDLGTLAAVRANGQGVVRLHSASFDHAEPVVMDLARIAPDPATAWANYVRGTLLMSQQAGVPVAGFDLFVASSLPRNAGLSSSAAIELATLHAVLALAGRTLDAMAAAKLARKAENEFVHVPCGLMDQFASAHGQVGHALYLDCLSEAQEALPLGTDVAIVIVDSQTHHTLADGQYARLRGWCESAARKINRACGRAGAGEQLLRHVSLAEFEAHRGLLTRDEALRAEHIVREQGRVLDGRRLLTAGDVAGFAAVMRASHASSRDLFGNSCTELDQCMALAEQVGGPAGAAPGAWLGGKLSGGGFGGATVNLVRSDRLEPFVAAFSAAFAAARGLPARVIVSRAGAGATHLAL